MRRLLFLCLVMALLAAPVVATQLTFQDPDDYNEMNITPLGLICGVGDYPYYSYSSSGGNSRVYIGSGEVMNIAPSLTTYWAGTITKGSSGFIKIKLLDASKTLIKEFYISSGGYPDTDSTPTRYELVISDGNVHVYRNRIEMVLQPSPGILTQNPSYVAVTFSYYSGCGNIFIDDWTYGTTEFKNIFGMPEHGFVLIKDTMGGASSGFYYPNETTVVSNYNMTSTWGKGTDNTSVTVKMYNAEIYNVPVCNFTTTAGTMAGTHAWPLNDCLFNNPDAHYGYYYTTVDGSGIISDITYYKGKGASVTFDKSYYSTGNTAVMTWAIDGMPYWDIVNYDYELRIIDIYGTETNSQAILTQTGSGSYVWQTDDDGGVYYVEVVAVPKAGGSDIPIGIDYATLSGTFGVGGYVNDDVTANTIPGAWVNITQSGIMQSILSGADGSYNSTGIATEALVWMNTSANGWQPFNYSFVPHKAHFIDINITLANNTHPGTGVYLGGVAREDTYARPLANVFVEIYNQTDSQYHWHYTNNAGWYNESAVTYLNTYNIWGSKTGYSNSTVYKKQIVGA